MRLSMIGWVVLLGAGTMIATSNDATPQATKASHRHMGHVLDRWNDTPEQKGLLPTATDEAEIASRHASLAMSRPDELTSIKSHIGHVMHAIDPSVEGAGPGKGYGVIKAAQGVVNHVRLAADAGDASDNVKLHARHVAASGENVIAWAQRILELASEIRAADAAATAADKAREVQALTDAILNGRDANDDGRVSWQTGEGGLQQASFHMDLMKRGEGTG